MKRVAGLLSRPATPAGTSADWLIAEILAGIEAMNIQPAHSAKNAMPNDKAAERTKVAMEFGILIQPFVDLANRAAPPTLQEWRTAVAKVESTYNRWADSARKFVTFASDFIYENELTEIRRPGLHLIGAIKRCSQTGTSPADMQQQCKGFVTQATNDLIEGLNLIPIEWEPEIFHANTPFTSYMRIKDTLTTVSRRFEYFDRYLKADFFDLFVRHIPRSVEVTLVTTAAGVTSVSAVSLLAKKEFASYNLVLVDPSVLHDRNLRVDDQIFVLGPGVDRAGLALTNFNPGDSTPAGHAALDAIIAGGTVVH